MLFRRAFTLLLLSLALVAGVGYGWLQRPLDMAAPVLDLSIEMGTSPKAVAQAVADAGVEVSPGLLYWWFRVSGDARQIKAGSYELKQGDTPRSILARLTRGDEALRALVLVEGWNFRQVREALRGAELLRADSATLGDDEIMEKLGRAGVSPEGRFFPDTYTYAKGSSDLALLKRAAQAMDKKLDAAWAMRQPGIAVRTPAEALTLASLIEKETGRGADRPLIASVFHNRLRIGMLLQTDPTVIYGLGEAYGGRLRRIDLQTDTPWNTYTRTGLPPTPIAMPGKAALIAAVQPAQSRALYFVARGDGSSEFSDNLDAHNRAVNKYIRGVKQ